MLSSIIVSTLLVSIANGCDRGWVRCAIGPCDPRFVSQCKAYPNATCVPNFCGGCFKTWTLDGDDVTEACNCDSPLVNCFADPCSVSSCPAFSNATCKSNYCNGCNAVWSVVEHVYVDDETYIDNIDVTHKCHCSGNVSVWPCNHRRLDTSCPAYPNAECNVDSCNECSVTWFVYCKHMYNHIYI